MNTIPFLRSTILLWATLATTTLVRAQPSLTVYNQNFAVVRDTLPLDLKVGLNRVQVSNTTASLEPDSVVLRDPTGKRTIQVMEQFYRADPLSQALLLSLYEGKTIEFRVGTGDKTTIVQGKIIRSGYVPGSPIRTNNSYYDAQYNAASNQPVIEVDGQLRFSLPGEPLFPALPVDTILKPTLNWVLRADEDGPLTAELAYVTGGMNWKADYNIVAPQTQTGDSDTLDLSAWITLTNTTGKTFENARIKLMAGDVSRVSGLYTVGTTFALSGNGIVEGYPPSTVTQKAFDQYHLYTLNDLTTLRDRETKQVEFARASNIKSQSLYIYDGVQLDPNRSNYGYENIRQDQSYGTQSNTKVMVTREFANTRENGLGIPLPKGRLRFYRRDADGQLEFVGENIIDHTPQGETVRVATGNAFDLVGERKRLAYKIDQEGKFVDESFQITLRNRKAVPVDVRVVEHLYRGANWTLLVKSNAFVKNDANTIEFRVQVPPDAQQVVTYTVHYTW
ncbi:hypothetical protein IAD21_04516 [Abditibacteriota bacterium]|nr:hypothetical protein IAD21_04516 [Abditibacteriota bacterium]